MDSPEGPPGGGTPKEGGEGSYWDSPNAGAEKPDWQPPSGSSDEPLWESPERGPQAPATAHRPGVQQQTPGNAVASLVLGILGLVLCPIICSVIAIVLGRQAKEQIERDPNLTGSGLATAGYIMGIVGLAIYGLLLAFWIIAIALAS
jgi:hypothetical protein